MSTSLTRNLEPDQVDTPEPLELNVETDPVSVPEPLEFVHMDCDCKGPRHMIRFVFDPEFGDLFLDIQMAHWPGFWKRCWFALKYIFHCAEPHGHWDCTLLNQHQEEIIALCRRSLEVSKQQGWAS